MGKDEMPLITRRTTRSSAATAISTKNNVVESTKSSNICSPSPNDLLYGGEPIDLDVLLSNFPGRHPQIRELLQILGPSNTPMLPVFVYGGPSTGKTSIVLQLFRHLNRPFVYSSCRTCYSPRILFESVLNQLSYHRKNATNGYSSVKRCEKPSDFVNFIREALVGIVKSLKENMGISKSSKKRERSIDGNMVYLIFDKLELVRDWDKSSSILPLLFNLDSILNIPEVGLIFISSTPPDTFYSSMGYIEPIPIYFPTYSEDDLRQILVRNQANPKLYSSFLDVVLRPFCRITRRLDELSAIFSPLFVEYCKPLNDLAIVPNEDLKRKLFSNLQPHISLSLNETFRVLSQSSFGAERTKDREPRGSKRKVGTCEESDELDFHMSTSAKYLLISAFLASRNPATLDASLFDSRGGSDGRKRRRKHSETVKGQKEAEEEELLTKGPGSFPLERLLAIFQCIISGAEDTLGEEVQVEDSLEVEGQSGPLMSDVLLQLSSLCNANFIVKGGTCPLEGSTRYRSVVSEDLALKVAKSVKFPLAKYVYRR
ncbi:origin of replication complex subunit 5 [Syzygium oleosum]|uniref:origin of replication complex subunit 5 n=1 Tax=Syzygium oleosum TaxID=219896 RepID=UPI0024BB4F2E|nr:origin of replication complex subunit 5 [Syzygium oleosum]XP_056161711.1 origin of replication complex subunit 5 [Syzygium oleosum]